MHGNHYLDRSAGGRRRREASPKPMSRLLRWWTPRAFLPPSIPYTATLIPYTATLRKVRKHGGRDERIRIEGVRRGPQILFDVIAAVAGGN